MTSTETYNAVATQVREATEKSVETFRKTARTFGEQANAAVKLPAIDLTPPVHQYFDYLQKAVDLNRDLATKWAELVTSLTWTVRDQVEKVGTLVGDQTETVVDLATRQAQRVEHLAQKQADKAAEAEQEQARLARKAEREEAKQAQAKAREPYEGLTKAELSDQLAERGLPKTGNIEELIERLVADDSE